MRLIDADALINRMYHDAFETDTDMQKWDSGCWIRYKMFENAIDEQPTIEPKQGKWIMSDIQNKADTDNGNYQYICSECGHGDIHAKTQEVPYCWWCGAKMKGADDD